MEVDADKEQQQDDTDMADAVPLADEEPEVQSPLKKSKPETYKADEPAAEPDKPSTAALAAGKRKGLTVAKAAIGELHKLVSSQKHLVQVQLAWGHVTSVLHHSHVLAFICSVRRS
jgi:hypothetical protein